jgi:hypothetical protein
VPSETSAGYTVEDLRRRWRISADKIRALIRAGKLQAINTSMTDCARPRYVVMPEEVARWEESRSTAPPPKSKRRLRKVGLIDFYPD